jgi:hypothetical protein
MRGKLSEQLEKETLLKTKSFVRCFTLSHQFFSKECIIGVQKNGS